MTISKKQFAVWSFERDRSVGLYPDTIQFNDLDAEEKKTYLEEAIWYIKKVDKDHWPDDIKEKLKE